MFAIIHKLAISTICALAFSFCDVLAACWARTGSRNALALALILSPLGYLGFALLSTKLEIALAGGLVNALIVVFTAIAGTLIFKEPALAAHQLTGLALIIIGIVLALYK